VGNGNAASTSTDNTVTYAPVQFAITSVARSGGNKKVTFSGTGAAAGTAVTITICKVNTFPCPATPTNQSAGTSTLTPASAGAWGPSSQSSQNLDNGVTYWAQAVQGSSSSAPFQFTVDAL